MRKLCKYFKSNYKWKLLLLAPFIVLITISIISNSMSKEMNELLTSRQFDKAEEIMGMCQSLQLTNIAIVFFLMLWATLLISRLGYIYDRRIGSLKWRNEEDN